MPTPTPLKRTLVLIIVISIKVEITEIPMILTKIVRVWGKNSETIWKVCRSMMVRVISIICICFFVLNNSED